MPWIDIVSRIAHILSAVTLGGGLFYLCAVQTPALAETDDSTRSRVLDASRRRWARLVMIASLFLILSGGYNYMAVIQASKLEGAASLAKIYHPMLGVKMILGLVVMFLAAMLSGRSPAAKKMQTNPARPLTIASVLVMIIITIAGVVKVAGHPKANANETPTQQNQNPETASDPA